MVKRFAIFLATTALMGVNAPAHAGAVMASAIFAQEAAPPHFPAAFALQGARREMAQQPDGSATFVGRIALPTMGKDAHIDKANHASNQARHFFAPALATKDRNVQLTATGTQSNGNEVTAYFVQTRNGVRIEGTYAMAVMQNDALKFARQYLVRAPNVDTTESISMAQAEQVALGATAKQARRAELSTRTPSQLAIIYVHGAPHLAWKIRIGTQAPWGARAVFVDAHDGAYLTYKKLSRDGVTGSVSFDVEAGCVGDTPVAMPMPQTQWSADAFTDDSGNFAVDANVQNANVQLESPYFAMSDETNSLAGPWAYDLGAAPASNELSISDAPLEQTDPYYHAHRVRAWLRAHVDGRNSQIDWSNTQVELKVNIPDTCNAYYDGGLNFFSAGDGCLNTGRTAGIVYHEYGHGIHDHSYPVDSGEEMDGQVSEGIADYVASTITGNPNMRGIFSCDDNFRSCVNTLSYCKDGCDMGPDSEVHDAGQVICAVWWEIREALIARYGQAAGADKSDRLYLKFLTHVGNMFSTYAAAIAADDDDDGNPANGTVHSCEINHAFQSSDKDAKQHFPDLQGMVPCVPAK